MRGRLSRTVAAVAVGVLLLAGCAGDARGDLRRAVSDLTAAANGRDAAAVRSGAETVLDRLDAALRAGELTPEQGAVIRDRALAVQAAADSIDANLIARREAERAAQEAQERLEAEREAAAEAERQRLEQERRQAEEEAEEEARKAAEEAEKEREKQREKEEKEREDDEPDQVPTSPAPSPSPSAVAPA